MKRVIHFLIAIACCFSLSHSAIGSIEISPDPTPVAGNWVDFSTTPGRVGVGGPFLARLASTNAGVNSSINTWYTFCVEADGSAEYINFGTNYLVESTSEYVASATDNVVTNAAKYLYYAYGHDLLTSLLPTYSDTGAHNADVQKAIWSLTVKADDTADPDDYSIAYNTGGYWLSFSLSADASTLRSAAIAAVTGANSAANLALASQIRILNPVSVDANGNVVAHNQSMLYEVPEPLSFAVWGGLIAVVGLRRRRRLA